jgi:Bacterial toxin YdaS
MTTKKARSPGLLEAIRSVKTVTRLTEAINDVVTPKRRLSVQAVSQWLEVPPERCLEVELATGISRHVLRPDIYGPQPSPGRKSKARSSKRAEARPAA